MKTAYNDIYRVLRMNRWVTICVTATALASSTFSVWTVHRVHERAMNSVMAVNTDGSVIPLKLMERRENMEVEVRSHLRNFHLHFYGLDPNNYRENIATALWLGDASVDNVYRQKKAEGTYNKLLQYSLVQKVLSIESQVDMSSAPYSFRTVTRFEIRRGEAIDIYELIGTGKVMELEKRSFPTNPHGLWITDYFEEGLRKIDR